MKIVLYVKCRNPEHGEMRLCLYDDVKTQEIAEAMITREKQRFAGDEVMLGLRRWEVEA